MPACVLRQARHISPSVYQQGPSDQVGAQDDATFGLLSIYGVTRQVRILARLRNLADLEARRLCIHVKRVAEFPSGVEVLPPSAGGRETFQFWDDDWSGHSRLCGVFPRFYALSTDPGISVRQAWHDTWVLALPKALADQRVAELLSLQELFANRCSSKAARDAWVWSGPRFTARAAYRLLRDQEDLEDPPLLH